MRERMQRRAYDARRAVRGQAAWVQVVQVHSAQTQLAQLSEQESHEQVAWLHDGQVHSAHEHTAQESEHFEHWQATHSS